MVLLLGLFWYVDRIGIAGTGTIEILGVREGSTVFIDNKRHVRTKDTEDVVLRNLAVGTHSVVVAKDGYWPWAKKLAVGNGEKLTVRVFILPQDALVTILSSENAAYEAASEALSPRETPTEDRPLLSDNGSVGLWIEDNKVMARWLKEEPLPPSFCITGACDPTLVVIPSEERVTQATFFPRRDDVILFGTTEGIFAIELDKRGTQNFQPFYLNTYAHFATTKDGTVAILDHSDTLRVILP